MATHFEGKYNKFFNNFKNRCFAVYKCKDFTLWIEITIHVPFFCMEMEYSVSGYSILHNQVTPPDEALLS